MLWLIMPPHEYWCTFEYPAAYLRGGAGLVCQRTILPGTSYCPARLHDSDATAENDLLLLGFAAVAQRRESQPSLVVLRDCDE